MNRTSILSILAGAGIYLYGSLTPDAIALARALQSSNPMELRKFADEHRNSPLARTAIKLSELNPCPPERRQPDGSCGSRDQPGNSNKKGYQS